MDLKMLLVNFGIIVMLYMQSVHLAKDSMEFSPFTLVWEDAESRCLRQGQVLVPGRRYRAKMIKKLMTNENVDAVWLNGWRAVSNTSPDKDGKLHTLKVDFSRPQNKELKCVCQLDSFFYDPLYTATSTVEARTICETDGAALAEVTTEEDVKHITEKIVVDSPHWINSISSRGSKIKQCLVAQRIGDDLKYSYDDCSKEYNFICVKGDDIISSFSPLISLKMARFEEFEEEIEKHAQSMMSSSETFELFSSMDVPFEFSTNIPFIETSTVQPKMTSTEITSSERPVTSTDTASDVPVIVTPIVQDKVTPVEVTSSVKLVTVTSDEISAEETSKYSSTIKPSATSILVIPTMTQASTASPSASLTIESVAVAHSKISSDVLGSTDTLKSSEITPEEAKTTRDAVDAFSLSSSAIEDIPLTNTIKNYEITDYSSHSKSQVIERSSIDGNYRESVFVDNMESESTIISRSDTLELFPSSIAPLQESYLMGMSSYVQHIDDFDATGYVTDTEEAFNSVSTEPVLVQPTQTVPSSSPSIKFMHSSVVSDRSGYYEIVELDEQDNETATTTAHISVTGPVLVTLTISASESQPPDVIMTPTSTMQTISSDVSAYEGDILPSESVDLYQESDLMFTPISVTSLLDVDIITSESKQTPSTSRDSTPHYAPTPTRESIFMNYTLRPDLYDSSKSPSYSIESSVTSSDCTVIDLTTHCIGTLISTADLDSTPFQHKTQSMTYGVTDVTYAPLSPVSSTLSSTLSSTPSSSIPLSSSSYLIYDMDKDAGTLKPDISSSATATVVQTSSMYDYDQYPDIYTDDYDFDTDDNITISPVSESSEVTPKYTIDTSDPVIDMMNETDNVDEEITGDVDKGDTDDYDNEVGNASADTGEIIEKKNEDEEGGIEVGLWVAFAILITLVLIALILAAYLYRKRKLQKSKDITTVPTAAGGETVELRDSRSPSRENGKLRESATHKDPAYDI